MKKIAILASGEGLNAARLAEVVGNDDRVCIDIVVTDRENAGVIRRLESLGVSVVYIPREVWRDNPENIVSLLSDHGIDLVVSDGFSQELPPAVAEAFEGRLTDLATVAEDEDKAMQIIYETLGLPQDAEAVTPPAIPSEAGETDRMWAERLGIPYDADRIPRQTPPPVPESANTQAPAVPGNPYYTPDGREPRTELPPGVAMPPTYLLWSVLAIIVCCTVPGIVALIYSSKVSSKYYLGDVEGARRASHLAEIWIIVSFVLGVFSATLYLPFMLVS